MDYTVKEKKLLNDLNRTDFAHIKKEEIIGFASKLDDISPEVAEMILDQYPQLIQLTVKTLTEQKEEFLKVVSSNEKNAEYSKELYEETLKTLTDELNKDLTAEERKENREALFRLLDKWDDKDAKNKEFLLKAFGMAGTFAVAVVGIVAAVLGGNFNFKLPNKV